MPSPRLWQFGLGPPGVVLQEELESVQKRAARFVTDNYHYETGSMTGILGQLKWESLKKRRKDNKSIYFSWFGPELFCLLLGPPRFNC